MQESDYPALYQAADKASNNAQNEFFRGVAIEYILLIIAAIFALGFSEQAIYYSVYAFIFILATTILLYLAVRKPEQDWYKCRALAESIKTSTWRYMMRADPFFHHEEIERPKAEFRNFLSTILQDNRHIGGRISGLSEDQQQITKTMSDIRCSSLDERKCYYDRNRIREQRSWYSKKVYNNKRAYWVWVGICVVVYILAIASVLLRIIWTQVPYWPTEPLIVVASSIVAWVQIKKFNELASAYTLTAHEIGIIQGKIHEVATEEEFSDFVNQAELAFSREHTQWVARQHGN